MQDYATGSVEANMYERAKQLRKLLTNLGPSFVKVGQALSSRPDLLPQPYLEVLLAFAQSTQQTSNHTRFQSSPQLHTVILLFFFSTSASNKVLLLLTAMHGLGLIAHNIIAAATPLPTRSAVSVMP